jgi:hypothetical protein
MFHLLCRQESEVKGATELGPGERFGPSLDAGMMMMMMMIMIIWRKWGGGYANVAVGEMIMTVLKWWLDDEGDGGDYDGIEGDGGDYGYVEGVEVVMMILKVICLWWCWRWRIGDYDVKGDEEKTDNWRWWEDDNGNVESDEEVIVLVLKWSRLLWFWKWSAPPPCKTDAHTTSPSMLPTSVTCINFSLRTYWRLPEDGLLIVRNM